jgi:undecaprenyl diphosphate synthase
MSPLPSSIHLPQHVAIIMDGNGRWAKKHHLPRQEGHKKGALNLQHVVETFIEYQIPYLTVYMFSTENWNRPKLEVQGLLKLLEDKLNEGIKFALKNGVKIHHLGKLDGLPTKIKGKIKEAEELTRDNDQITLGLAFNYGSRDEIVEAIQRIIQSGLNAKDIDDSVLSQYLYTADMPDPDLIIRPGGEMRLSNFLLWQAAYAEIYFTPVLWPDFNKEEIDKALITYSKRQRRFGNIPGR